MFTDGHKELIKTQQQTARRGLKHALAEVHHALHGCYTETDLQITPGCRLEKSCRGTNSKPANCQQLMAKIAGAGHAQGVREAEMH